MRAFYQHTQRGYLVYWLTFLPATGLVVVALSKGAAIPFLPVAAILFGVGFLFSSLTVEVTATELGWYFGPGFRRKRIARDDIEKATPVRNEWWWGWGVHLTPRGWLYNVSGLEGVEIALTDGRTLRIGSDEPQSLAKALSGR
jgi:hypothetical protein